MAMKIKEYAELMEYIQANHSWENNLCTGVKIVKYIDSCTDTRDGEIWIVKIKFRQLFSNLKSDKKYDAIVFREGNCTKEKIIDWLKCN
jgi:hypothetical protein